MSAEPPRAGELLVSTSGGNQEFFDQSVVLLLDCDHDGALGVTLNKLAGTSLEAVLPDWTALVAPPRVLFAGGPVSPQGAVCVAKLQDPTEEPPGWRPVIGDIGLLHLDTPVEIASGGYTDLRIFAGYSGWAPGQLDEELARGAWFRMPSRDEDIFTADPTSLWRRILRRHGGTPALLSTWPKDPELN
ncbi:MAG: YqgE/AlgH family protein [Propionibacterium sp.]|mgnify:CR=1 FL=1|jgi:putative transcriptional regulator|uniref:YqgE/AlgH family protein n=1 Tax=Brooklawnia propionicigenes TaxID=3041175 RepID=UPI0016983602|nr:YqgE/AlgH family protein [Brooklawnia sp. SH051]MEA5120743.1 YqgE/AlgH family protein [Propionibacterium sp.]NLI85635.1 YqgE/AlgH family protein [Propionibacterium sp.]